jgi:hypothetical protein
VKENEVDRSCIKTGGEEECIWYIGGKVRKKETLGRPIHSWVNNIKWILER